MGANSGSVGPELPYWKDIRNLIYRLQTRATSCCWIKGLNVERGHSRSSKVAPFDSSVMTSYSSSIVTVAVACTVCEILAFEL